MSLLNRFKNRIHYEILKRFKPEIIGYPKNFSGERVVDLRISNTSHISNRKNVTLGNYVFVGHFTYIDGFSPVTIGAGCQITNYVSILTHSSHHSIRLYAEHYGEHWGKEMLGMIKGPVEIGDYSFIGPHSVIMPGTIMGKGCIVSAFSFVSGKFDDYSIIRGIPAKVVGNVKETDLKMLEDYPRLKNLYFDRDGI